VWPPKTVVKIRLSSNENAINVEMDINSNIVYLAERNHSSEKNILM
jgi:hypothetical protein